MPGVITEYVNVDVAASRPSSPNSAVRQIYLASDTGALSGWDGSAWHTGGGGGGSASWSWTDKSANYTIVSGTDHAISMDASGAARTVTLPTAVGETNFYAVVKTDSSANTVTVDANSTETINNALTYIISTRYDAVFFASNGTNWYVISPQLLRLLLTTKGDIVSFSTIPARLGVGSDGQVLTAASGQPTGLQWATPSAGSLTTANAYITSNVTMTSANTFYDGGSASLAAGTWLIIGTATVLGGSGAEDCCIRIWNGTTVYAEAGPETPATGVNISATVAAIVVLGSTTTVKVSAALDTASGTLRADPRSNGSSSHVTTGITAVKVA